MGEARPARRIRQARDAAYREVILETAERLFGSWGYQATKMADIARAAGISLATLYGLFPGKRDLRDAITADRGGRLVEMTIKQVQALAGAGGAHPLGVMLRGMATYMGFFMSQPDYLRMILFEGYAWWHSAASPSREQEALWEHGKQFLMAAFRWGIDAGALVDGEPDELARLLTAQQQTRLANWLISSMRASKEAVIAGAQAELVRTFCRPRLAVRLLTRDGTALEPAVLRDDRWLWQVSEEEREEER